MSACRNESIPECPRFRNYCPSEPPPSLLRAPFKPSKTKGFLQRGGQDGERLWRTLKYEEVYLHAYDNLQEARTGIGRHFAFPTNRTRRATKGTRHRLLRRPALLDEAHHRVCLSHAVPDGVVRQHDTSNRHDPMSILRAL